MTGIKRIYKKRAMVKRPEKTERPTKGLVSGRGEEESDRSQSRKLFSKKESKRTGPAGQHLPKSVRVEKGCGTSR